VKPAQALSSRRKRRCAREMLSLAALRCMAARPLQMGSARAVSSRIDRLHGVGDQASRSGTRRQRQAFHKGWRASIELEREVNINGLDELNSAPAQARLALWS